MDVEVDPGCAQKEPKHGINVDGLNGTKDGGRRKEAGHAETANMTQAQGSIALGASKDLPALEGLWVMFPNQGLHKLQFAKKLPTRSVPAIFFLNCSTTAMWTSGREEERERQAERRCSFKLANTSLRKRNSSDAGRHPQPRQQLAALTTLPAEAVYSVSKPIARRVGGSRVPKGRLLPDSPAMPRGATARAGGREGRRSCAAGHAPADSSEQLGGGRGQTKNQAAASSALGPQVHELKRHGVGWRQQARNVEQCRHGRHRGSVLEHVHEKGCLSINEFNEQHDCR